MTVWSPSVALVSRFSGSLRVVLRVRHDETAGLRVEAHPGVRRGIPGAEFANITKKLWGEILN